MAKKEEKEIRVTEYSNGKGAKIDFYSPRARDKDHDSIHIKIDTDKKTFETITKIDGKVEKSKGGCYLTTACMKHQLEEFDDNCYELFMLRWLRDHIVSKGDIKHYYEVTPLIVESIDKLPESNDIYNYIYENVIIPCVVAIKHGDFEFAYNRYKNSILALEKEYVSPSFEKRANKVLIKQPLVSTY